MTSHRLNDGLARGQAKSDGLQMRRPEIRVTTGLPQARLSLSLARCRGSCARHMHQSPHTYVSRDTWKPLHAPMVVGCPGGCVS